MRALGLLRTKILPNECGGGVAQTPTRQEDENKYADGNGIAGQSIRAENANDAYEADPAGVRDEELQNASQRNAQQAQENSQVDAELTAQNADALRTAEQAVELIEHADAAAGESSEGRAGDTELGKWPPAENETGIEDEIDDVRDPEQSHGDGRVAGPAKDGVVEKEHHDNATAAERDARITGACSDDLRRRTHQAEQIGCIKKARQANHGRKHHAYDDGLNAGDRRTRRIFFADAARDHGGGGKTQAEPYGHHQTEHRLRKAHSGNSVRAEAADPENINDGKQGLEHHLKNHRDGKQ